MNEAAPEPAPAIGSAAGRASQLETVCEEVWRSPLPVLAADALLVWLLFRAGLGDWALAWLALSSALSCARALAARRLRQRHGNRIERAFRTLFVWFVVVGLTRSWPIVVAFVHETSELHYAVTMIMMGMAAGGVGTVVGVVPLYLAWAAPVAVTLMSVWLLRGNVEGAWIALLLLLMFTLLTIYVRDFGRILGKEVKLRQQLQEQRDLALHEERRAEAEHARAEAERLRAQEAVVARTRFFETASHDLRQPLGVLRWYGDTVALYAQQLSHDKLQDVAAGIERALDRIEPLVDKYLHIARLDAASVAVAARPVVLADLLAAVCEAFVHEAGARGLELRVQIAGPPEATLAMADESLLRSILDNLTGNAIKFTHAGQVVLSAGPSPQGGPFVRLAVSDTGIGIPESERQRVFDDFYQVANPGRTGGKGVGLGLAIARRQAQLLRCELRITAPDEGGTTFHFDLPLADAAAHSPPVQAASAAASGREAQAHALRVLVIDDEAEVRRSLRQLLEAAGATVGTAHGVEDALGLLRGGFEASALIVDYRLHGHMDGLRVLELLAQAGFRIPAVIVTGETAPERLNRLASAGLPVLHKPVGSRPLIATLLELARPA